MAYDARYSQPCPIFPESQITLDRLIWSWEKLRDLNTAGYRSSQHLPREGMPTWLIGINWAGGASSGPSAVAGTSCSPMTVQSMVMALATEQATPFHPKHSNGNPVSALYNTLANGNFRASNAGHMRMARNLGITSIQQGGDNGWARANIFFNFAYAVEPKDMRRGDIVGINWMNGGGHATYCWDVHLNSRGEVDAFQYVSSNGSLAPTAEDRADGLTMGRGKGFGVSVGGGAMGGQFIREVRARVGAQAGEYRKVKSPYFSDDERFVSHGGWTSWDPAVVAAGGRGLAGTRVPVRVSVARCRSVKVARPFGIRPPEPYAMGGNPLPVTAHTPDVQPQQVNQAVMDQNPAQVRDQARPVAQDAARPTAGQLELEQRLKMLYELQIIDKDPGVPDNVNDAASREAVKSFQVKKGLRPTGNADTRTKQKLRDTWTAARATPEGRNYIATGVGTRPAGGGGGANAGQAAPAPAGNAPAQAAPAPAGNAPAQAAPAPAGNAPAQAAPAPAQAAGQAAPAGGAAQLVDMYFRHGFARAGDSIAVTLVARNADGRSFPLKLKNVGNGQIRDMGAQLTIQNGQGAVAIRVPAAAAAGQAAGQAAGGGAAEYVAIADGLGETPAALYVPA